MTNTKNHTETEIHHINTSRARQGERSLPHEEAEKRWKLLQFVQEVEKHETIKNDAQLSIKATLDAADEEGFDKKQIRQVVKNRKQDQAELDFFNDGVKSLEADLAWAEENPRWKKAI